MAGRDRGAGGRLRMGALTPHKGRRVGFAANAAGVRP